MSQHHPKLLISAAGLCVSLAASAIAQPCGSPWSVHAGAGPSARDQASITYDSVRGKVVLFGGRLGSSTYFNDTWEWTAAGPGGGGSWAQVSTTGPSVRALAGLAYDSVRQRTVLFGGIASGGANNQTWEWNGSTWTQILPAQSPPAVAGVMAFDSVRNRTVLASSGTWEYDGSTWTGMPDSTPVISTFYASIAFDATRGSMVLFGANSAGGLWERGPSGWSLVSSVGTHNFSPVRIAYNSQLGRIVYVDGTSAAGPSALWAWDWAGLKWSVMNTGGPARLMRSATVFDAAGGQVLTFGGASVPSGSSTAETRLVRSDVRSGPVLTEFGPRLLALQYRGVTGNLNVTGAAAVAWRRSGVALTNKGPYSGVTTPTLTIDPTATAITASFDALVTDPCGTSIRPDTQLSVTCYANCDGTTGNPIVTAGDFQCFVNAFAGGMSYANCDGSTGAPLFTANDFLCFLNEYVNCQ